MSIRYHFSRRLMGFIGNLLAIYSKRVRNATDSLCRSYVPDESLVSVLTFLQEV
jgi:hypothetical protein